MRSPWTGVSRTVIIAEIGENHAGDWALASDMVRAAARAGAAIVKFQSYRGADVDVADPERDWFTKLELPDAEHIRLKAVAEDAGVSFLSAPFSVERAQFLVEEVGLRQLKIASSEMLNQQLLDYANRHVETVFLSTGMATLDEVQTAVSCLDRVACLHVLHCVSEYPCPPAHANLRAIATLQRAFPSLSIGWSDHMVGYDAACVAVALGARVIEKHFTVNRRLPGTDHVLSLTEAEFRKMVARIADVEELLHDGIKQPSTAEGLVRDALRRRFSGQST